MPRAAAAKPKIAHALEAGPRPGGSICAEELATLEQYEVMTLPNSGEWVRVQINS